MYFPPFTPPNNDIIEQLMQLETMSYHEQLRVVRDLRRYQLDPKTNELVNRIERKIETNIKMEHEQEMSLHKLESENQELKSEIYDHKHRLSFYEEEIQRLRDRLSAREIDNLMICSSPKGYKNLFIFLFAHPNNHSNATKEILSRMNYLDKMTRDVHFTMPGYEQAKWFFCNLVEEYMFHYEFPLQQFDTSSPIHYSLDSLQLVDVPLGYSVGDV